MLFAMFLAIRFPVFTKNISFAQNTSVISRDLQKPVVVSSSKVNSWESNGTRVFVCMDDVMVRRGNLQILSDKCVFWFYEEKALQSDEASLDAYFEGNVSLLNNDELEKHDQIFLRLDTNTGVVIDAGAENINSFEEEQKSDLFVRANLVKQDAKKDFEAREKPDETTVFSVSADDQMINVFADQVDSWIEGDKRIITAIGNVIIKKGEIELKADNVILYFDQKDGDKFEFKGKDFEELYAEGNVTLRQEGDVHMADSIFINYNENKGILVNSKMDVTIGEGGIFDKTSKSKNKFTEGKKKEDEPFGVHIKGDEIKLAGKGQYEIKNGEFTSCSFDHPHYKFKSSKIRIMKTGDQTVVSLAGNKLYWGKRPVFYWPYLSFDVRSKPNVLQDWETGNSSRFGSFVTTNWDLFNLGFAENVAKWSNLILNLDYMQKRGAGAGLKYDYEVKNAYGYMDTYYINDKKDEELNGEPVDGEDRWRLLWRHRQFLPYDVRLDLEANNISDDGFLREFNQAAFKEGKDEETVVYLRRLEDTSAATFLINKQLNSFDTFVDAGKMDKVAERLPELSYRIIGEPLWHNWLNYTTENTYTYFDRLFDDTPGEPESESATRIDSNNEISAPFNISMIKVKPYVGGRFIGYSDSVDNKDDLAEFDDNGSALARVIGTIGVDMSTSIWKTYSYYNKFFNINRLRHVFTPEFRYSANPFVTHDPEDINQFDSVDTLDDAQWLLLGFRNKLQTKRGAPGAEKIADLVYFDVELNVFAGDEAENSVFNNEVVYNQKREDFIQFDLRAQINDHLAILSERNEFNISRGRFDVFNIGVAVDYSTWTGFIGQRFLEGESSSLLVSSNVTLSDKWEVGLFEQYDFRSTFSDEEEDTDRDLGRNLKTKFVLTRFFHEWMGSFTTEFNPVRDETTTRFDIFPRALKKKERASRYWF